MNLDTLENRLHILIKRPANQNQQFPQLVNPSSSVGTMIPTPGMSHSVKSSSMVTSSVDTSMVSASGISIAPTTVKTGNLLQVANGLPVGMHSDPFNSSDGTYSLFKGELHHHPLNDDCFSLTPPKL